MRKLDEKKSEVGRDKRRIETLEKQVDSFKDRLDKVTIESSSLEQKHFSLKREVATLTTQVDAALYTNAKLNALIPNEIRLAIEEEVAQSEKPKVEKPKEQPERNERRRERVKEIKEINEPNEPSAVLKEPLAELKEPVTEHKEPLAELIEPVTEYKETVSPLKEEIEIEGNEPFTDFKDVQHKNYDDEHLFDTSVSLDIDKGNTDEL